MPYNPVKNKKSRKWYNRQYKEWNTSELDYQKQRVYAMEYCFFEKERLTKHFKNKQDIIKYITKITGNVKFKKLFGVYKLDEESINLHKSKYSTTSYAVIHDSNYVEIHFSRVYLPRYIVMHELAHCICPYGIGHGPLFCRVYADLIGLEYGDEERTKFFKLMDDYVIDYKI
jgi:hypothetical protein